MSGRTGAPRQMRKEVQNWVFLEECLVRASPPIACVLSFAMGRDTWQSQVYYCRGSCLDFSYFVSLALVEEPHFVS